MKKIWIAAGIVSALALVGCGGGEKPETKQAESAAPAGGAAAPDLTNGATITGKVTFTGTKPALRNLDMSAVPACMKAHPGPVKSQELVTDDNGGVQYAFIWVKSGLPDQTWQIPTDAVLLDQSGCMYQPHVIGIMAGQNIDIKTSDPINHNIHPMPAINQDWNESQAPGSPDKMKSFPRQEVMVPVKCNIHPWMKAYIGVVNHPFYAVTGADGTYTIKGLPPGTYTIQEWQEKYGTQEQQITVGAKDSKTLDFAIKG